MTIFNSYVSHDHRVIIINAVFLLWLVYLGLHSLGRSTQLVNILFSARVPQTSCDFIWHMISEYSPSIHRSFSWFRTSANPWGLGMFIWDENSEAWTGERVELGRSGTPQTRATREPRVWRFAVSRFAGSGLCKNDAWNCNSSDMGV